MLQLFYIIVINILNIQFCEDLLRHNITLCLGFYQQYQQISTPFLNIFFDQEKRLNIDVEDTASIILDYKKKNMLINVFLNV